MRLRYLLKCEMRAGWSSSPNTSRTLGMVASRILRIFTHISGSLCSCLRCGQPCECRPKCAGIYKRVFTLDGPRTCQPVSPDCWVVGYFDFGGLFKRASILLRFDGLSTEVVSMILTDTSSPGFKTAICFHLRCSLEVT